MATSPTSGPGGGGASAPLTLTETDVNLVPLTVVGAAGQASDLLAVKNSTNDAVLEVGPTGQLTVNPRAAALGTLLEVFGSGGGSALKIQGDGAGDVGFITLRTAAGKAVAINSPEVDIGTSGVGTYCYVGSRNVLFTDATVVPADADLGAGNFALWLDATPGVGNTKLMVKAKDSGGTVRTVAIVLA